MDEKNKPDQYVEYLNSHILPHINYDKLHESYDTDMVYAKGILNRMHEAMVSVYGGELLDETDGDEGIVVIPGIVRGKNSGNLCLALLDLDLSSSGEHWGTAFLCKSGVISQNEAFSNQAGASEMREAIKAYAPYDYCYTALIPDDIHVDSKRLPAELVAMLNDFRNHKAVLTNEQEANAPALYGSDGYQMDDREFESRMTTLLPGIGSEDLKNLCEYAKEMEEDGNISASGYFKQVFVEFGLVTGQHGQEAARQLLEVCKTFALNPWEIRDAADSIRDGVPLENIGKIAVDVGFDRNGEQQQEFEEAMEAFEKTAADEPQPDNASADLNALGTDMMDSFDFLIKMDAMIPGADSDSLQKIIAFAQELDEEGSYTKSDYLRAVFTEYDLATRQYGQDITRKLLDLSAAFIVNPSKISGAAMLLHNGAKPEDIPQMVVSGKCAPPIGGNPLPNDSLGAASGDKSSVLDKIREAAKEPKEPKKNKPSQKKTGPEL